MSEEQDNGQKSKQSLWNSATVRGLREGAETCWQKLIEWCDRSPRKVGLAVFGIGFVFWTPTVLILSIIFPAESPVYMRAYLQGLALIGLAGPTAGFTYWRGQQAKDQIEKAQGQIEAARRQTSYQSFNDAIQMAVDVESPTRAVAGWKRLERWVDNDSNDSESLRNYIEIANSTALSVLALKFKTKVAFEDGLERYEQAKDTPPSWEGVRRQYFKKADDTRINEDVRQQALEFLLKYPPMKWTENKIWRMSDCDLSDLTLGEEVLKQLDPEGEWGLVVNNSHCIGMDAEWEVNLSKSQFAETRMMGADLSGANLSTSVLVMTDLRYASMRNTDLRTAFLDKANLASADLVGADLTGSRPANRDLFGCINFARFHETQIGGANLSKIADVSAEELEDILKGCWWDRNGEYGAPLLPEGINADDIPESAEDTVPAGGEGWEPPRD
ncbi:MAG: pentapeptide repeat-containing protein [Alphaproteobacteria bacterium]|nr:pentapeptide repeat-containing protein [Alphaproteobacteria bacterium]